MAEPDVVIASTEDSITVSVTVSVDDLPEPARAVNEAQMRMAALATAHKALTSAVQAAQLVDAITDPAAAAEAIVAKSARQRASIDEEEARMLKAAPVLAGLANFAKGRDAAKAAEAAAARAKIEEARAVLRNAGQLGPGDRGPNP